MKWVEKGRRTEGGREGRGKDRKEHRKKTGNVGEKEMHCCKGKRNNEVSKLSIKLLDINCHVSKLEQGGDKAFHSPGHEPEPVDSM